VGITNINQLQMKPWCTNIC